MPASADDHTSHVEQLRSADDDQRIEDASSARLARADANVDAAGIVRRAEATNRVPQPVPAASDAAAADVSGAVNGVLGETDQGDRTAGPKPFDMSPSTVPEWKRVRFWVLVAAAVATFAAVEVKLRLRPHLFPHGPATRVQRVPAPLFEAYDTQNRTVKFARYVGRHEILVLFFDGTRGLENCREVQELRAAFPQLAARGVVAVAVTDAIPQVNRRAIEHLGSFPFPILSDPAFAVFELWRCRDIVARTGTAVFVVDRAGLVAAQNGQPQPHSSLAAALSQLLGPSE